MVSILVLMELCIKTVELTTLYPDLIFVSILVLMELCIKTPILIAFAVKILGFNPCFNGTMYKNGSEPPNETAYRYVSILVLMELCIKT